VTRRVRGPISVAPPGLTRPRDAIPSDKSLGYCRPSRPGLKTNCRASQRFVVGRQEQKGYLAPVGAKDNSPAIYRWEKTAGKVLSPGRDDRIANSEGHLRFSLRSELFPTEWWVGVQAFDGVTDDHQVGGIFQDDELVRLLQDDYAAER
jgi:hypothetical protein